MISAAVTARLHNCLSTTSSMDVPSSQMMLEHLLHQLKSAYGSLSGCSLTIWQAARLLDVDEVVAEALLNVLVAQKFVHRSRAAYGRTYAH